MEEIRFFHNQEGIISMVTSITFFIARFYTFLSRSTQSIRLPRGFCTVPHYYGCIFDHGVFCRNHRIDYLGNFDMGRRTFNSPRKFRHPYGAYYSWMQFEQEPCRQCESLRIQTSSNIRANIAFL